MNIHSGAEKITYRDRGAAVLRSLLRNAALGLGILVVASLALLIALRFIFPPDVLKKIVVERLEQATGRRVSIEKAGFTILRGLSINASGIEIGEDPRFDSPFFARADNFYLKVRLLPLLSKRIEIRSLLFVKPEVYLVRDSGGFSTASLTGRDSTEDKKAAEAGPGFAFLLASASIEQALVHYSDRRDPPLSLTAGPLDLKLSLDQSGGRMRFLAQLELEKVESQGASWADVLKRSLPLRLTAGADVDPSSASADINRLEAELAGILFEGDGRLTDYRADYPECSLKWRGQIGDLERTASVLPEGLLDSLGLKITKGRLDLSGTLRINPGGSDSLDWSVSADIAGGKVELRGLPRPLNGIDGRLTMRGEELLLERLDATFGLDPLSLSGRIVPGGESIPCDLNLKASLRLDDLPALIPALEGWSTEGQLKAGLALRGGLKKLSALDVTGQVTGQDIILAGPDMPNRVSLPTVAILLEGADIRSLEARIKAGQTDLNLQASISGWTSLLDDKAGPHPVWQATLSGQSFDIFDFVAADSAGKEQDELSSRTDTVRLLPLALSRGSGTAHLDRLVLSRFLELKDASLAFSVRDSLIELEKLEAGMHGGRVEGAAKVLLPEGREPQFEIDLSAAGLGAGQAITPLASFGRHLSGLLDARIHLSGQGLETGSLLKSLSGAGEYSFRDGTVSGWPFLSNLASFSGLSEMDTLSYQQWGGRIALNDGRVRTDDFTLATPAGDWSASGSFGFDGSLDYGIKIRLNEALSAKYRSKLPGEIAGLFTDKDKRVEIGFKVSGSTDKPGFKWDASLVKQRAREKVQDALTRQLDRLTGGGVGGQSPDSVSRADSSTGPGGETVKKTARQLLNNLLKKKKNEPPAP